VRVDEPLVPCAGLLVVHLKRVDECGGTVLFGEVLELGGRQTFVVGACELLLDGRARLI
jgi:hypothetical protein